MKTIEENPHLFPIVTPINVDCFEELLATHPNQPYVKSVCTALREGFWPWADTHTDEYPITHDNSDRPLKSEKERLFLREQRDVELSRGRYSESIGKDLLPGMYSMPIHAVPKPHSEKLRLVNDQSAGKFSLNSMILRTEIGTVKLDSIQNLFDSILEFRRIPGNEYTPLILFKSDVAEAFRNMPLAPLFQIKQISTIDGERHVDHNCTFGSRASPSIWCSFMGLVMWIAAFIRLLEAMKAYVDDTFSFDKAGNVLWYDPYKCYLPAKQTSLLQLWDDLSIPHQRAKQEYGPVLTLIGFQVDPNAMTITMPSDAKRDLIAYLESFLEGTRKGKRHELREFQRLAGWVNWSLNVFPLLKPGLSNVYAKMSGKTQTKAQMYVGKAVTEDLRWLLKHLRAAPGIYVYKSLTWDPHQSDLTIYCDASGVGMGFYIPSANQAYHSGLPLNTPSEGIFFFEALAVCSALHWASNLPTPPKTLTIFSDNTNSVDIFNSLRATPTYNAILKSSIDARLACDVDLQVLHVPGELNTIADAISRLQFDLARSLVPGLNILPFTPPQDALGAGPK
jgi:hypothetical protein